MTTIPKRGDACEAWLEVRRDSLLYGNPGDETWQLLDELLEDYRLHADLGIPLSEEIPSFQFGDHKPIRYVPPTYEPLQEPLVTRMDPIL